jgi:hypothetical protein
MGGIASMTVSMTNPPRLPPVLEVLYREDKKSSLVGAL